LQADVVKIAVLKESAAGESRVAASAETVKKFIGLGAIVAIEAGAGSGASVSDADYTAAGASVGTLAATIKDADIILGVQGPDPKSLKGAKSGAWLAAGLNPFVERARVDEYAKADVEALAMEFMPRITRAQSMDILSSQSNLSGYKAVLDAAGEYGKAFPMMMTAAGTVSAARVFVMGVGVAGLQAIATASARKFRQLTCVRPPKNRLNRLGPRQSSLRMSKASKAKDRAAMPQKCLTSIRLRRPHSSQAISPSRIS
jgi:H+-translocating NAD(P) transhydrogenase subunit alpha